MTLHGSKSGTPPMPLQSMRGRLPTTCRSHRRLRQCRQQLVRAEAVATSADVHGGRAVPQRVVHDIWAWMVSKLQSAAAWLATSDQAR